MSFEVRINGQRVWSTDRQVTRIAMQGNRGEIGAAGIGPADGVVDLFVQEVAPGGPLRLDQVEAAQQAFIRDVAEGTETGTGTYTPAADANKQLQGDPPQRGEDIPPGGPNVGEAPELVRNLPEHTPTGASRNEDGSVDTSELETGTSDPRVNPAEAEAHTEDGSVVVDGDQGDDDTGTTGENPDSEFKLQ